MTNITRVGYDSVTKKWKHLHGEVPEIKANNVEGDYYVWVPDRKWLIRFFAGGKKADEAIGVILTADGTKIRDIPRFVPPEYSGLRKYFTSLFGWVMGQSPNSIDMTFHCSCPADFRARYNLDDGTFQFLGFGFR